MSFQRLFHHAMMNSGGNSLGFCGYLSKNSTKFKEYKHQQKEVCLTTFCPQKTLCEYLILYISENVALCIWVVPKLFFWVWDIFKTKRFLQYFVTPSSQVACLQNKEWFLCFQLASFEQWSEAWRQSRKKMIEVQHKYFPSFLFH